MAIDRSAWSLKVQSAEEARRVVRETAMVCYALAALHGVLGLFMWSGSLWDAAMLGIIGLWLHKRRSVLAAGLLVLISLIGVFTTLSNLAGRGQGGRNIVVALLLVFMGVRAMLAAMVLRRERDSDRA